MKNVLLSCLMLLVAGGMARAAEPVDLLIVAGQSNAVGYDAHPDALKPHPADPNVLFWWRCGDPPPDAHDSTSRQAWTRLQAQPLGNPKQPRQGRQYGNFAQKEGGFGPEIGLARTIWQREQKQLAVVKVAFSGTSIAEDWDPGDQDVSRSCYQALLREVRQAIQKAKQQGIALQPRALAWIQGESDATEARAPRYADALGDLIAALRKDLEAPQLAALVTLNPHFGEGRNAFVPEIIQQQKRTAARDARCLYVDTSRATTKNAAHYDSPGTLLVGQQLAAALLRMEDRRKARRHVEIVTLGDSITKGVRGGVTAEQTFAALIERRLTSDQLSVNVTNVGIGGERTDQAWQRLKHVIALQPDIVTIMYGTNDSYVDQGKTASRISVEQYREHLERIVAELLQHGVLPVLMTEPRWSDKAGLNGLKEHPNVRLEPYLKVVGETAAQWRVPLVDHYAHWTRQREQGVDLHEWTTDGCHPNPAGHRQLVETMLPVLQTAIGPGIAARPKLLAGGKVVCFGDSVTGVYYHTGSRRAYTDMLAISLRRAWGVDVKTINAGISGHTTANALSRLDKDVLAHKPDVVTVMYGLNDVVRVPLDKFRANLVEIVARCRAAGAEVVLATPNNVVTTTARPSDKLVQYCDAIREVASEHKVALADCYRELDALRQRRPDDWNFLMSDPIHPNMDGHKQLAVMLGQAISGVRTSLDDVNPAPDALRRTREAESAKRPVRVLAMAPLDERLAELPGNWQITRWDVNDKSCAEILQSAQRTVRAMKPDLVLLAIPEQAAAKSDAEFAAAYSGVMNYSLNFGPPTWDCVVVHPRVLRPAMETTKRDTIVRRLVRAQDLSLIDRAAGDDRPVQELLKDWFEEQRTMAER